MYVAESLHYSPKTITTLSTGYTLIQNEKLKKQSNKGLQLGRPGLGRWVVGLGHTGSGNLSWTTRKNSDCANHTGETHTHCQVAREKPDVNESVTRDPIYVKFRKSKTIALC